MDFLTGVNRLLRRNNIIKGDDDDIINFDDNQHAAKIELAQIAIQDELTNLVANELIPYEKTTGSLTTSDGVRTYTLASDFIRMFGRKPYFYYDTDNQQVFEYEGGEDGLRLAIPNYLDQVGSPIWWYPDITTTKKIAFYPTIDPPSANRTYTYEYEKDVSVSAEADTLPFHNDQEAQTFIQMAARRFKYLEADQEIQIEVDPLYQSAKATLLSLMRFSNRKTRWGVKHG